MSDVKELVILPVAMLPTILAADDKDILRNLLKELEGWEPDISTVSGRKEIASKAQKVRIAKADFGRLASKLKEDAIKTQKAVNGEFKILEERMDALINRVRGPLDEYEAREKQRIADHDTHIARIEGFAMFSPEATSQEIAINIPLLAIYEIGRDWQEFKARADKARMTSQAIIAEMLADAEKREAEAAELVRLRAEEAERQRLAEIEARRIREEQIAAEAAERAKAEAEAKAAQEAREAEERAQTALQAAKTEADRKAKEAEEAAQAERDAAARRDREAAHALAKAEREKQEAIDRAERDRIAAEKRAKDAADKADRDRAAAVEAERKRLAAQEAAAKAEADRRAKDKARRGAINRDVLADMVLTISEVHSGTANEADTICRAIITAIANGNVRHTAINYAVDVEISEGKLL